jgi:glycosyltransferase involved in cell wall biosynthesis
MITQPVMGETGKLASEAGLSIVVPAYNEEGSIGAVIEKLSALAADSLPDAIEIIVVDDGSQDRTFEIASSHPQAAVIPHSNNRGYGAALKSGIQHASHELICITDADGTYPNERIPDLVTHLREGGYDMVVGARMGDNVAVPLLRRPAKWVINQLANFVADQHIPDLNSGLRVFRRSVVHRYYGILPNSFSFTTTITLAMLMNGYQVGYLPVDYYARVGRSKIRPIQDTLNFIQLVLKIALYFAPLRVFLAVGAISFLPGTFLFVRFLYFYLINEGDGHVQSLIFGSVLIFLSLQAILLGAIADLIATTHRLTEESIHRLIRFQEDG